MKPKNMLGCPFCDAIPEIQPWHGGAKTKKLISCENEDCFVQPSVTGETEKEAVARWSVRAMTTEEIKIAQQQIAKGRIQARISTIEAEKEFLQRLLSMPLDAIVDKIKNRLREADIQISVEQKYLEDLKC